LRPQVDIAQEWEKQAFDQLRSNMQEMMKSFMSGDAIENLLRSAKTEVRPAEKADDGAQAFDPFAAPS